MGSEGDLVRSSSRREEEPSFLARNLGNVSLKRPISSPEYLNPVDFLLRN